MINLSSNTLKETQKVVLSKGLNFASAPKCIPTAQIVSEVETAIFLLHESEMSEIRHEVTNLTDSNLTEVEREALKEFSSDTNIAILKADKGNSTVVMDRSSYNSKIIEMLSEDTTTYKKLKSDPTKRCEVKMKTLLRAKKDKFHERT